MTGGDIQAALLQALMRGTFSQLVDAIEDVPAQVRAIVAATIQEERKACAQVADDHDCHKYYCAPFMCPAPIAQAIRARGQA